MFTLPCSNFYQLVKTSITVYRLLFHAAVFIPCKFSSRLNTFEAIDIQPPNNALFLAVMLSASPMHFKFFFIESDISSNVNRHSWLGMSSIKVPCSSLWGKYLFSKKKLGKLDEGYYKPIKTKSFFNGNYIEYESKGVKDKNVLLW